MNKFITVTLFSCAAYLISLIPLGDRFSNLQLPFWCTFIAIHHFVLFRLSSKRLSEIRSAINPIEKELAQARQILYSQYPKKSKTEPENSSNTKNSSGRSGDLALKVIDFAGEKITGVDHLSLIVGGVVVGAVEGYKYLRKPSDQKKLESLIRKCKSDIDKLQSESFSIHIVNVLISTTLGISLYLFQA